jgi:hypothetical protein
VKFGRIFLKIQNEQQIGRKACLPLHLKKWHDMLFILHKYVTYEGRYGLVFYYHLILLMNFVKGYELDMPFYLMSSLNKMDSTIQHNPRSLEGSLFHFGLIKMLVEERLQEYNDNWEQFLIHNHYIEAPEQHVTTGSRRESTENRVLGTKTRVSKLEILETK